MCALLLVMVQWLSVRLFFLAVSIRDAILVRTRKV